MLHSFTTHHAFDKQHTPNRPFSFLLILGIVLVITALVGSLSYLYSKRSEEKESSQLLQNFKDRADVLVWALEGSARTMMGARHAALPLLISGDLLEEIANQPSIVSICLVNDEGEILVHSDPDSTTGYGYMDEQKAFTQNKRVQNGHDRKDLPAEDQLAPLTKKDSIGRFSTVNSTRIYEVIKRFTPNDRYHMGRHRRHMMMEDYNNRIKALGPLYMIVAFDAQSYDDYLLEVRQKNKVFFGLITVVTGSLTALALVLYSFSHSRRLLNDARALASQIVTNLPIGIITTDKNGDITLLNSRSLHLLSLQPHSVPDSITQLPRLNWREIMQRLDTTGKPLLEEEIEIPLGQTGVRALSLSAAKVFDGDGSESGYLYILRDLQTVKSLQKQIRLNERLSALSNMAAGVAHEIRNPLSTLKGYATYLSEKLKNDPKAYATGRLMIEEVERLNRVVSDLLYLSKPGQLRQAPMNLKETVQKAIQLAAFDASSKNIAIDLSTDDTPLMMTGDADRLIQALLNILLNSVQAIEAPQKGIKGSQGTIAVSVHKEQSDTPSSLGKDPEQFALIRIRDTGTGMSEETLSNMFTPYFSTKASGSGLGMTITHQIIDLHEGTISVSSVLGKGTIFTIRLPLQPSQDGE